MAEDSELAGLASKIFEHKWLDNECIETGCQSLLLKRAVNLLGSLTFSARTACGTAGPDQHLMEACERAETFIESLRARMTEEK